jgi:DNA polymerase-3 subunit chi
VLSGDAAQREALSQALWTHSPESFLAHGELDGENPAIQPILLADRVEPANGARFVALADGLWRDEALGFERVFLLFGEATIAGGAQGLGQLGRARGAGTALLEAGRAANGLNRPPANVRMRANHKETVECASP